jgi:CheY-like chemotaxis protein/anti-sigma regulatory factor (Ser/Thr protein kinase)
MLDIARLEGGAMRADIIDFELGDMYEDLERQFTQLAARRGLRLRVARPRYRVRSDRVLLRRVLQNLISNALRYTRQGGVLVGCQRRGEFVDLCVWDSGPGIPEQHQRAIFDEFRRLDGPSPWGEKGLGLGLSICDRIARLLSLELNLRSTPGRGSVFRVRVPLGEAAPAGPAAPTEAPPATAPSSLVGLTALCIDNEPEILAGMISLMSRWGVRVVTASDAREARAITAQEQPSVVLADYRLAETDPDGLALLAELCGTGDAATPGALVTADHSPALAERARQLGFPLLRKPVKPAALRALMGALAAQRNGRNH